LAIGEGNGARSGVRSAKLYPPAVPEPVLARPALEERLDMALARRLGIVTAGAGFGKSTLLSGWAADRDVAWYTLEREDGELGSLAAGIAEALRLRVSGLPLDLAAVVGTSRGPDAAADELGRADAYAGLLCDALQEGLADDLVLVLDDLHELGAGGASCRLVEGLCRQCPSTLHVMLASRADLPFPVERLRGQGQVVEVVAGELAFTRDETAALLGSSLGDEADELAASVHEATGGWPAAVRLALEALRGVSGADRRRAVEQLRRPGSPLFTYLAGEVFDQEGEEVRELVRAVAPLERFTAELCEALGVRRPARTLASLSKRGLFVEPGPGASDWFALTELSREFALQHLGLSAEELASVRGRAAAWLEHNGHQEEALCALAAAGDCAGIARLLAEHGEALISAGAVEAVARAVDRLPPELRDACVERVAGQALQIRGDWEGALACFERAAAGAHRLDAAVAWRMGLIYYLRGQLDEALRVYERARLGSGEPRDDALLLAGHASVDWRRTDLEGSRAKARRALEIGTAASDPQALAAAHTVLAMVAALEGDRAANESQYLRALDHAERAGDVLQIIRVRTNRGSRHLEEGAYEEALAELEIALRLADLAGFAYFRALALHNRGTVRLRLGRFEEAIADLEAAKSVYQRIGSSDLSYPLSSLGEIRRERGDLALARAAYEEAVALAEESGDLQSLVPALAGLARVLAAEDPEGAAALAERAVSFGPGMGLVEALLASAVVALAAGESERAAGFAAEAEAAARARRDRAGLAEALELGALASPDPAAALDRAEQALAVWRDVQDPFGAARAQLLLARLLGAERGRGPAREAEQRLRALGARRHAAAAAALLAEWNERAVPDVAIEALGRFRVLRSGDPVPAGEWQSKKARDLLKLLVARRGHPVAREAAMEILWPGGDPAKVANRLSVALSTVRAVLDPEKRFDGERFVPADRHVLALELAEVEVDVEVFLAEAAAALDLLRTGSREEARERLAAAEALYAGDFLEEDAYEDWAVALREEARAAYIRVARALADDAAASGDHDTAARYLLRSLEKDGYDEEAHLRLVATFQAAGRHGEARRAFQTYAGRMAEIGMEAASFPPALRRP
jgi:ATP/maltotriose-dependent transcriptional regulator MalT/DNA-binding SARP family transcriptional activator